MKKLVLALGVVAVVCAAVLAWVLYPEMFGRSGGTPKGADGTADSAGDAAANDKARDAAKKPRTRSQSAEEAPALAIAGVVKTADGKPVAGATIDAFAVAAAEDVPDEERVGRAMLVKMFGKPTGDRLWTSTKGMRDAGAGGDPAKALEAAPEMMGAGMSAGMEMLSDDGGMDALMSVMGLAREAVLADDAPWQRVGGTTTGADGTFRIEGLAPGKVELRAKAPGHVKTKQRVPAGDVTVSIQLVRGARLAGVVTCEKAPVVGAVVVIKGARTTSGAGGRFEFDAAHAPMETLVVSAPDCVAQGRLVALSLDVAARDVAVELEPAGALVGHVSSVTGGVVVGARVTVAAAGGLMDLMSMAMSMGSGGAAKFDVPAAPGVTDGNGAFEIQGVRTGAVKVRIEADGYLAAAVSVDVKKGQNTPIEALLVGESVLAGTVTDEKGAPIAGARVRVEVAPRDPMIGMIATMFGGGTFRSAYADDKGAYEVHGLAEGERKVRAEAAKFLTSEEKVTIPAQAPTTRNFALRPGYKIAGTVAGPDGKPFAGAKIYATGKPAGGMAGMMAGMMGGAKSKDSVGQSGADGKWTADGLPEGPYEVKASADGLLDAEAADVAAGRTDVALTLGAAATIRGHVVALADLKPVAGAKVARKSTEAPTVAPGRRGMRGGANPFAALLGGASATSSADGGFEMKGLTPGEYALTGTMKGFADSEPVKVTCVAGEAFEGVEIRLPPGVAISGRVVEKSTGAAVAGALVWSAKSDNPFAGFAMSDITGGEAQAPSAAISARTDADGRFVLDGLPPGAATLEVRVADHAPTSLPNAVAPSTDVLIQVGVGGAVEGHVTGEGGPVTGAQIQMGRGMGMMGGGGSAKTDGNGDYRIDRLPPGTYQIKLVDTSNMMTMFMPGKDSVTVKDGETVRHDFTKKGGPNRQFGGAALRDGKPLANAPVVLMGGSSGFKMATTDESGRFAFEGLDPGDYTVLVQSALLGGGSTSKKVNVGSEGKVEDVRLELSSAKVEGDVIDAETGKGVPMAQIALMEPGSKSGSATDMVSNYRGQAMTDERGHFQINDVQNGTFSLRASATDFVGTYVDGVASGSRDVQVRLRRGVEFAVTVLTPDDKPVVGATVQSVDASGHDSNAFDMTMSGITKTDGVAKLRLAPGRYTLRVAATGMLPTQADADTASGAATVRMDAGGTILVVAKGADGSTPLPNAKVTVLDVTGNEIKRGMTMDAFFAGDRTDQNGAFTRAGLPPGEVFVVVADSAGHEVRVGATLVNNRTTSVEAVVK